MNIAERLRILEAAENDPALLALTTVDLAHPSVSDADRARIKEALLAAAVPHWCDQPFLAALLDTDAVAASTLMAQLRQLRVVEPFPARGEGAINVHEATRLTLRDHLRTVETDRWRQLAQRARDWVSRGTAPHTRIEAVYHAFAVDQVEAAAQCALMLREVIGAGRPEVQDALALALKELDKAGWLTGVARIEAQFPALEIRRDRGEAGQIEDAARELLRLSREAEYDAGITRALSLIGSAVQIQGRLADALETFSEMLRITRARADREPDDFFWRVELARAIAGTGDVQFSLGQTREAGAAFDENLKLNQSICEINPGPAFQRDLVGAQARVADLLVAGGRYGAAQDIFLQSLEIAQRLANQDPLNAGLQRDVGVVYGRITDGYSVQGRRTEAMAAARKYLGIFQQLTSSDATNADWQRELSMAHARVGDVLEADGKRDEALAEFEEYLRIARRLAELDPSNSDMKSALGYANSRLSRMYVGREEYQRAHDASREFLEIFEALAARDAENFDWHRGVGEAYASIADVYLAEGKAREALDAFGEQIRRLQALPAPLATDIRTLIEIGNAQLRIGDVHRRNNQPEAAADSLLTARATFQQVVERDPSGTASQRRLATAWYRLAAFYLAQKDHAAAAAACAEDLRISRWIAEQDPDNALSLYELAGSLSQQIDIETGQGHGGAVRDAYAERIQALERAVRLNSTNLEWQRELGVALRRLGWVHQEANELEQARATYVDARRVFGLLVAAAPGDRQAEESLTTVNYHLSTVLNGLELPHEALAAGLEDLRISLSLTARYPDEIGLQRGLAVSHGNVANLYHAAGNSAEALAQRLAALEIFRRLLDQDEADPQRQSEFANELNRVADLALSQSGSNVAPTFMQGLNVAERLADERKDDASSQYLLANTYFRAGLFARAAADAAGTRHWLSLALERLERAVVLAPENTGWTGDITLVRNMLAAST